MKKPALKRDDLQPVCRQQTRWYVHAPPDAEAAVITNETRRGTHVPLCVRDLISLPAACVVYLLAK